MEKDRFGYWIYRNGRGREVYLKSRGDGKIDERDVPLVGTKICGLAEQILERTNRKDNLNGYHLNIIPVESKNFYVNVYVENGLIRACLPSLNPKISPGRGISLRKTKKTSLAEEVQNFNPFY